MELIAAQCRGRARVLLAKLFVLHFTTETFVCLGRSMIGEKGRLIFFALCVIAGEMLSVWLSMKVLGLHYVIEKSGGIYVKRGSKK